MESEISEKIAFAAAEAALATRFDLPADALIPLIFSLHYGGNWSYSGSEITAISAMKRATVYDDESRTGYSLEEIYLFVNPVFLHREGTVHRLEKCGDAPARVLARRPYRVRLRADRVIRMTVHPLDREIRTEELDPGEMTFSGRGTGYRRRGTLGLQAQVRRTDWRTAITRHTAGASGTTAPAGAFEVLP